MWDQLESTCPISDRLVVICWDNRHNNNKDNGMQVPIQDNTSRVRTRVPTWTYNPLVEISTYVSVTNTWDWIPPHIIFERWRQNTLTYLFSRDISKTGRLWRGGMHRCLFFLANSRAWRQLELTLKDWAIASNNNNEWMKTKAQTSNYNPRYSRELKLESAVQIKLFCLIFSITEYKAQLTYITRNKWFLFYFFMRSDLLHISCRTHGNNLSKEKCETIKKN